MQYLQYLPSTANIAEITREHKKRQQWINQSKKGFLRYREPYKELATFRASHINCNSDTVIIGDANEVDADSRFFIKEQLRCFMPWRKGPFSIFGNRIDAEWRSERKWRRVLAELPDLNNKVIADIGCNNGYYMFRMAASSPRFVLGFEPSVQHYYCFKALNAIAGCSNLDIDLLGVEHLNFFKSCFDVVFLMGIIYHRPSPIDTLRDIHGALKPGGTLILETQGILGEEPYALFPDGTYAKVPGTYFVPTAACLANWLKKAGFVDITVFDNHPMSSTEQRRTEWMEFESYSDFIDPKDPSRTIEGYPAPWRIFIKGLRKQE